MHHNEIIIDQQYAGLNPMQFGYEDCVPGHFYGPAVRTHWLLHYVVAGKGRFEREGKSYPLSAGDLFIIPPYLETYYQADERDPWRYIWIGFTTESPLPAPLSEPVLRLPGAAAVFEEMKGCSRLEKGRSAFLAARLWELFSLLLEQGEGEIDYVEKALNLIHSEYMNPLSVQEIAHRLGLDRCYFSTLFKDRIGLPPLQYLIRFRMEKAAELMVDYGESASTAGASVGYPDLYHFSKAFKAHFGVSPRAYCRASRL
jgi:AraC-like DNA-binding protein